MRRLFLVFGSDVEYSSRVGQGSPHQECARFEGQVFRLEGQRFPLP